MQAFLPQFLCSAMNGRVNLLVASEVDSRKKLVALLDTHTLVNEFGLG